MFGDQLGSPVSWLDVGAGYGEVIDAAIGLFADSSVIRGVEPIREKAKVAQELGLSVEEGLLSDIGGGYTVISSINVLSHIPIFRHFFGNCGDECSLEERFCSKRVTVGISTALPIIRISSISPIT